jgi:hypothetical protein
MENQVCTLLYSQRVCLVGSLHPRTQLVVTVKTETKQEWNHQPGRLSVSNQACYLQQSQKIKSSNSRYIEDDSKKKDPPLSSVPWVGIKLHWFLRLLGLCFDRFGNNHGF